MVMNIQKCFTVLFASLYFMNLFAENSVDKKETKEISANEDLMREHGLLNRLLLIYEKFARQIDNHERVEIELLAHTASIVRNFVEDYHEKLEEKYVFPILEKAGKHTRLIDTLKQQHDAGRTLTDYILKHANQENVQDDIQKMLLSDYLKLYIRMFRPHEAREDTIVFPEFKKLISNHEYERLGKLFEEKEEELFGKDGFEKIEKKISEIEQKLAIYNLEKFTPAL
jgi:hemerythrin-like domain-containing protein